MYVGFSVGEVVGALLGDALGSGVGEPPIEKTRASLLLVSVTPLLSVTSPVTRFTATTVVPAGMPEPVTVLPTAMDAACDTDTVTVEEPETVAAEAATIWAAVYVGVSVGDAVGALLGEALGIGVGTPAV